MSTKDYSAPTGQSQVAVMSTHSIVVHRMAVQFIKANRRNFTEIWNSSFREVPIKGERIDWIRPTQHNLSLDSLKAFEALIPYLNPFFCHIINLILRAKLNYFLALPTPRKESESVSCSAVSPWAVACWGYVDKHISLYDIWAELNHHYKDLWTAHRSPNTEEIFNMLTKETPETFYTGESWVCFSS